MIHGNITPGHYVYALQEDINPDCAFDIG